ncbi:MAG: CoA transferase [Acidobacteriia bacterium]|nr:CoA transferase [Methyloceanibacter sp.]MBX5471133.1 CoA transferase [Acetobacteraceae bacterium]MCL6490913.1 CoA transferase [Terriglobia bacterium]
MSDDAFANGPLSDVRVLDLTSVIMGPFATHILADMGADVIKIESPDGDLLRRYKPYRHAGMSGPVLNLHRNKRSVVLDLKSARDRTALDRLIATADVFLHAMRPAAIARLGYDYERVRSLNPDIVYCGAYGFSAHGPYGGKAAYDDLIQAGSGIAALNGLVHGAPAYVPTVICDKLSGQAIAYALLAALYQRARGGGGQQIEVPMFETTVEFVLVEHLTGAAFDPPLSAMGFERLLSRGRKPYRTKDGFVCILPYSDRNWLDFYEFTGRKEFLGDERFTSLGERVRHIDILYRMVEEEAAKRTTAEWVEFCDRVSIPCMPVLSLEDLVDDPHLQAVGMFGIDEHPSEGRYRLVRRPIRFSSSAFRVRLPAPRLGEHTREILSDLGFTSEEIAEFAIAKDSDWK